MVKLFILWAAIYVGPLTIPEIDVPPVQQEGFATWYGDGNWHGDITANGEEFKPLDQTCASRQIPINTVVLVEDKSTGRRVWCRVNDRGPYGALYSDGTWGVKLSRGDPGEWRGVMDLSLGTARALAQTKGRPPNHQIRIRYYSDQQPFNLARLK